MRPPSNRAIAFTTLILSATAALTGAWIAPPLDIVSVVAATALAGVALTSYLASRTAQKMSPGPGGTPVAAGSVQRDV